MSLNYPPDSWVSMLRYTEDIIKANFETVEGKNTRTSDSQFYVQIYACVLNRLNQNTKQSHKMPHYL